jgi:hypothetical protein
MVIIIPPQIVKGDEKGFFNVKDKPEVLARMPYMSVIIEKADPIPKLSICFDMELTDPLVNSRWETDKETQPSFCMHTNITKEIIDNISMRLRNIQMVANLPKKQE